MVSTLVSAILLETPDQQPDITIKLREINAETFDFCKSDTEDCNTIPIYSNYTRCYCNIPTSIEGTWLTLEQVLSRSVTPVGIVFLILTLVTFSVCRRQLNVNNVALANLCVSLLLTHIFILIKAVLKDCGVLTGFLHYFFLSAFMWMLIDAVLLFISAIKITKLRSSQREMFGWKSLIVIGYVTPLVEVSVSNAVVPAGYNSTE
ncbi:adhesion G protein-coupled receptor E1-like [Astyanax mexicanus]|uniref:Adhesion G protein-coupled receptor E1-like n=1 Tax=Astyanax mexicanus TaxID=7994 RepID=A0A8T2KTQ9_ASTMX|nr:adhesion G protein-coupled receptor E1-like [Astyanax mexicanus]